MSEDSVEKGEGKGPSPVTGNPGNAQTSFDSLGELPSDYRQMFVVARDPHWLFTYWDFDYAEFPQQRQLLLQIFRGTELETTIDINEIARNWYIPVQHADADYQVAFGWRAEDGNIHIVGEAGPTHTPPESISTQWDSQFATVPFHLGFNFLMDVIETAKAKGEPLTQALARLQQAATESIGGPSSWSQSQLRILETLFGKELVERLSSMDSAELTNFLRADLATQLDSESASELLAKGRLAQLIAPEVSSLFSAFREVFGGQLSSAGLSSLELSRAESSETLAAGSESMASWQRAVGSESRLESGAALSSLSVGVSSETLAGASESLASWQQALGSESRLEQIGLSSLELLGGLSSAELSSAALSSFSAASELFALGLSSAELSSAALSSGAWSGLEFPLSSWSEFSGESSLWSGFVSSWGGAPERSFFMHVNAEVIFYGGTDPRAKVSIAGQPVQLQPDGTFRYHFRFPDNDFEIPIVAVSPDGQETRSAVLYFRRETTRQGDVGSTNQPVHLVDPMGAKR
jgi:hypothetical protein